MQKIRQLNLSELPNVESLSIFMSHDEDVEHRFAEGLFLTEVYERSNAALLFFHKVSSSNESSENSAYLRAASASGEIEFSIPHGGIPHHVTCCMYFHQVKN